MNSNFKNNFSFLLIFLSLFCFKNVSAQIEVGQIKFEHTSFVDNDELYAILQSEEGEDYEARLVKLDLIVLKNFFLKQGYLLAEVRDSISFREKRTKARILYIIDNGPRFYYKEVRFSGYKDISLNKLQEQFENLETGNPFDESKINQALKKVENLYYNRGKPYVEIKSDYLFEDDSLVVTTVDIKENQTVYINKIQYNGLDKVQRFIVRRELELRKGDRYSREELEYSQKNIYSTGLFKYVRMEIEPVMDEPDQAILNIFVQEKDARWVGLYMGVAHQDRIGSSFEFTGKGGHRNIAGTARSVSLSVTPAFQYVSSKNIIVSSRREIAFTYVEPWIGNTRTPGTFRVSLSQNRPTNSRQYDLTSTSFQLSHKYRNNWQVNGTISAKFVNSLNDAETINDIIVIDKKSQTYSLSTYFKKDTRPNLFNPQRGYLTDVDLSYSQSYSELDDGTKEDNQFFTLVASWSRYQPWRPRIGRTKFNWTLASRIKLGQIIEIGESKSIPVNERFYAGGSNTVRGFSEQLLGPAERLNDNGKITQAAGGKVLALANIEARIPIFWIFVGEIFVDAGNVWQERADFNFKDIRFTSGAGLAVITPLGPLRVDYGYKLDKRSTDPERGVLHFGIYFAF